MDAPIRDCRILIVDDQPVNVTLLQRLLAREGYTTVRGVTDAREAAAAVASFDPDLVLLDLLMPYLDGVAVLRQIQALTPPDDFRPVLVLTADITPESRLRVLQAGAKDFLTKPFDRTEVLLRIRNLLETRWLHTQLRDQNGRLEERVRARTAELEAARVETLERLALAAEYRDDVTGQHTQRVGTTAGALALTLGLDPDRAEMIRRAAPLHDLGKIGIRDAILLKPARLTVDEFDEMKEHTRIGARILSGSSVPLLRLAEEVALTHHERWDGTGYPRGLRRDAIPLAARIVSVADVYDALTHERPYKQAWPADRALAEIVRTAGTHFDPAVVDAFTLAIDRGEIARAMQVADAAGAA